MYLIKLVLSGLYIIIPPHETNCIIIIVPHCMDCIYFHPTIPTQSLRTVHYPNAGGACPRPSKLKNEPEVVVPTHARVSASTENWKHVIGSLVLNAAEYESIPE